MLDGMLTRHVGCDRHVGWKAMLDGKPCWMACWICWMRIFGGKAYQERVSGSFYSLCVDSPCWMACWICWMHVGWKPQSNMRGNALYDRVTGLGSLFYVGYVGLI